MRVVIVEDEQPARDLLMKYLESEMDIEIVDQCADGFSAAVAINKEKPDLVLLDIQLPKLNGFEMLEVLDHSPLIIFTTAYDEYAIKAFEQNAVDYLLKPFSRDRFQAALCKAREKLASVGYVAAPVDSMAEDLSASIPIARIVVKDSKGIHIVASSDIRYFEAQDDYVMIYSQDGRFMKKQTMKSLEQRLNPRQFVRVHRSYIVNVNEIVKIEPYEKESYLLHLKGGDNVKASASGYRLLKECLEF
ncbi:MAG: LytTR family DNA-binding domain-containing protein [Tenuifilaceae bacterium]|jgi:two-component system LytT family response regulator|nr:LytTR family DNA-binding domain-containing protein [Tenuifilaceae bacterium]